MLIFFRRKRSGYAPRRASVASDQWYHDEDVWQKPIDGGSRGHDEGISKDEGWKLDEVRVFPMEEGIKDKFQAVTWERFITPEDLVYMKWNQTCGDGHYGERLCIPIPRNIGFEYWAHRKCRLRGDSATDKHGEKTLHLYKFILFILW